MAAERKITVVAQIREVSLDSGRHLAPGEVAEVVRSDAVLEQIAGGLLVEVPSPPAAEPKSKPESSKRTSEED
jgi:hypothetical protein